MEEKTSKAIWFVGLVGILVLWMVGLFIIGLAVNDVFHWGRTRGSSIMVNSSFLGMVLVCLYFGRESFRHRLWLTLFIGAFFIASLSLSGSYAIVLGLLGSPSDSTLKRIAISVNAPEAWIQDNYAPPLSAATPYMRDVWGWWTLQGIIALRNQGTGIRI